VLRAEEREQGSNPRLKQVSLLFLFQVRMLDICKEEGEKAQQQLESQFGKGSAKFSECDVTNKEEFASQ
jgi:hypothetical protein